MWEMHITSIEQLNELLLIAIMMMWPMAAGQKVNYFLDNIIDG